METVNYHLASMTNYCRGCGKEVKPYEGIIVNGTTPSCLTCYHKCRQELEVNDASTFGMTYAYQVWKHLFGLYWYNHGTAIPSHSDDEEE